MKPNIFHGINPQFEAIWEKLTPETRDALDAYFHWRESRAWFFGVPTAVAIVGLLGGVFAFWMSSVQITAVGAATKAARDYFESAEVTAELARLSKLSDDAQLEAARAFALGEAADSSIESVLSRAQDVRQGLADAQEVLGEFSTLEPGGAISQDRGEAGARSLPVGAVIAFDLTRCPEGWQPLSDAAGRTIVGAGQGSELTPRRYRETGGEEYHQLIREEMPAHEHSLKNFRVAVLGVGLNNNAVPIGSSQGDLVTENATGVAGENLPHNNMQPFIALFYCVKT